MPDTNITHLNNCSCNSCSDGQQIAPISQNSRRDFFKSASAIAAGAVLPASIVNAVSGDDYHAKELFSNKAVKDGKAISLKGNPDHPITKGFLCGKVSRYIERTYHPTRLLHPLKRVGAKGEGRFEKISWQEAIDTVASKLGSIIDSPFGPQSILPYSYAGTMGRLQSSSIDRRFFHRIGASLLERTICATAGVAGSHMTLGARAAIDPEAVLHSKLIINWGSNTRDTNSH